MNWRNSKNHQNEAVSGGLFGPSHKAKRNKVLICDTQQESRKKKPSKLHHKFPKKKL
jgi:hypothetical protein